MLKVTLRLLLPLLVVALTASAALACGSGDETLTASDSPDATPRNAPVGSEPVAGNRDDPFEVPGLTAEEIARAEEALAADPRAKALLNGEDYSFKEVTPVIDSTSESDDAVGVAMLISLDRPISAEGTWLLTHDAGPGDPEGSGPKEVPVHFSACAAPNGVREVIVFVDFANDELVQFEPLGVPGFDVGTKYCQEEMR